jgi:AAA15 family ATPase/GTPase
MKIKSIEVNNMYSYDEFNIEFNEGIAVIVGPNNAGKSNLFRLIEFLKNSINGNIKTNEIIHHLHDETKRNACIKINVEFGNGEKELLKKFLECYFSRDDVYSKPDEEYIDIFIEIISKGKIVWEYNGEFEGYIQPVYYATPKIEMNGEINTILELINNRKNELIEIIGEDYDKIKSKYLLYQLSGNKTMISNDKSDGEVGEKLKLFETLSSLELITDLLQGKKSVVIEVSSDRIKRYKYNDRNSLNLNTNFKSQSPELFLNITNKCPYLDFKIW